jgi:hypothetical protein
METQTIQLEALSTSLHGAKILYQLPSSASSSVSPSASLRTQPPWSEWIQRLRQPFRKAICLTNRLLPFITSIVPRYDATFQVRDSPDWTLILTYITYAPKPLLVVVEPLLSISPTNPLFVFIRMMRSSSPPQKRLILPIRKTPIVSFNRCTEPPTPSKSTVRFSRSCA